MSHLSSFFGTRGPQCTFPCPARPPLPGPAIPATGGPDARPAAAMARPAIGAGRGTATAATSMNMHATTCTAEFALQIPCATGPLGAPREDRRQEDHPNKRFVTLLRRRDEQDELRQARTEEVQQDMTCCVYHRFSSCHATCLPDAQHEASAQVTAVMIVTTINSRNASKNSGTNRNHQSIHLPYTTPSTHMLQNHSRTPAPPIERSPRQRHRHTRPC